MLLAYLRTFLEESQWLWSQRRERSSTAGWFSRITSSKFKSDPYWYARNQAKTTGGLNHWTKNPDSKRGSREKWLWRSTERLSACASRKTKAHLESNLKSGASTGILRAKGKLGEMWIWCWIGQENWWQMTCARLRYSMASFPQSLQMY